MCFSSIRLSFPHLRLLQDIEHWIDNEKVTSTVIARAPNVRTCRWAECSVPSRRRWLLSQSGHLKMGFVLALSSLWISIPELSDSSVHPHGLASVLFPHKPKSQPGSRHCAQPSTGDPYWRRRSNCDPGYSRYRGIHALGF